MHNPEKKFPAYFSNFKMPEGCSEEAIEVYRACRTQKVEKASFLPSYEDNGFSVPEGKDPADPIVYSLSTYEKAKDAKRFLKFQPKHLIAVGKTEPCCGPVQRTKDRIRKCKSSHIDWWLYEDAVPYKHFRLIEDFESYISNL